MTYGLLALRLVVGLTMAAHGSQKLFAAFDGPGLKGTAGFFEGLGFRPPLAMAFAAGCGEFFGGLLFAAGLATPLGAFLIVTVMLVAIATVHWTKGFFVANGGFEFNVVLLTVAAAVAATGPGRLSLDRAAGWDDNLSGAWWGAGVVGTAALAAVTTLAVFRERHPRAHPTAA